jgi:phage tail sheath protein FI
MALNIGVNVVEVDGRASPEIEAAPTSVAAFLGFTERGLPNRPVAVRSLAQFRDRFGSHLPNGYLAYAVEGFFLNGGREAYVCRVAGTNSAAAAVTLNNRAAAPAPALRVTAGYRGQPDPGDWGGRLRLDVRDDPKGSTKVVNGPGNTQTSAQLESLAGVRVGSVVRFVSGSATVYKKVTAVGSNNTINWTGNISAPLVADAPVSTVEFRLIVRYQPTPTSEFVTVEDWGQLSMEPDSPDYAVGRLNHQFTGSRYVTLTDLSGTAATGEETPAVASGQAPVGGAPGTATVASFTGDQAAKTGVYAFDAARVQLLAVPDAHLLTPDDRIGVVRAAIDYCAGRGDCMYVGSAPDRGLKGGRTVARSLSDYNEPESVYVGNVKKYSGKFQGAKVYGGLYAPWVRVNDPAPGPAPTLVVPPEGHVMGVYARTDLERGIFKAPAGTQAQLRGVLEVSAGLTDGQMTDLVRNGFVNPINFTEGLGVTIAASRTLSTDTRWWFVSTRLLFNFVKSSLREGLRFVRQEPHSEELRRSVKYNVVTPFLLGLWRRGAFGTGEAADLFTVVCGPENNPPAEVNLGNFKIEVYFYPVKPAETIVIVVGQQPSGGTAGEA